MCPDGWDEEMEKKRENYGGMKSNYSHVGFNVVF